VNSGASGTGCNVVPPKKHVGFNPLQKRWMAKPGDVAALRPKVDGKFLALGGQRFYPKGVTYGAFPPNSAGHQFPEPEDVEKDFDLMAKAGINTILTYTVPSLSLLDHAQKYGIRVIVNTAWMAYVCFLQDTASQKQVREEVKAAVASCRRHPAVMMYCVAKEIPPQIVRWHGARAIENFLKDLYKVVKDEDPEGLVTYTNFPTTEYLDLSFVDVFTFNVYLHNRLDFCAYLSRIQHRAGELPFLMTEFGMCSFRHGREGQAAFLDWQIEEIFDHGLAGAIIFSWTDPFYEDKCLVTEWGFGLVDAQRQPKPAYEVVRRRFTTSVPFPPGRKWPRVSVIVAAHNAGRTLEDCLRSLQRVRYPDYEVIVVNDGSKDDTEAIIRQFPFRCITTVNQGISAARNEGLRAATGEIVAYIDSDANADPDWLHYLAVTYMKFDVAGVGGPNLVPREDNWIAKCVYRSPGGPTQVMVTDQYAEHIPGCNMSFRRAALETIGGFDPIFRAAADDVDICWRLLEARYLIGFAPSAVVWHHRRPTIKGYWRQQVGYGVSESILERKMPHKFNPWGHAFWAGRIYAPYPSFRLLSRPVIYHGLWGSAPFQPMYDPGGGNMLNFLPRAMEWHFAVASLIVVGFFFPWALVFAAAGIAYTVCYCCVCAANADLRVLETTHGQSTWWHRLKWRVTIAWLHMLEPLARDWGRLKGGLTPWRSAGENAGGNLRRSTRWWQRLQPLGRTIQWEIHGSIPLEKIVLLQRMHVKLQSRGWVVGWNPASEDWDLKIGRGALAIGWLRLVVEHHGGPKRRVRVSTSIAPPRLLYWTFAAIAAMGFSAYALGWRAGTGLLIAVFVLLWASIRTEMNRLEAVMLGTADEAAADLQAPALEPSAYEQQVAVNVE
jgi:O-antigen biosynthesis protein